MWENRFNRWGFYYSSTNSHVQITANKIGMRNFADTFWPSSTRGKALLLPRNPSNPLFVKLLSLAQCQPAHAGSTSNCLCITSFCITLLLLCILLPCTLWICWCPLSLSHLQLFLWFDFLLPNFDQWENQSYSGNWVSTSGVFSKCPSSLLL